ncbi:rap guanine nucleotide exchange factor 4 isoform X2 [Nematostella vectensis]|uniref:rap guanine nucleotide exchange factor 4 isoform X2 n=1 Tax=Nematostella vectensis TaxID=45351 RepID=UPI002076DFF8|nr:rap guanine nucleotide exchange factor 4 isoform X2 [Nematostella vectensis]
MDSLLIRPFRRTGEHLDTIFARLRNELVFKKVHPHVVRQICFYAYYEDLEPGTVLYRQDAKGLNWYAILTGSVNICVSQTSKIEDAVTLCCLGPGSTFGESVLDGSPRTATAITNDYCELLCVNGEYLKTIFQQNRRYLVGIELPGEQCNTVEVTEADENSPGVEDVGVPLHDNKKLSQIMLNAAVVLHNKMVKSAPHLFKERSCNSGTFPDCFAGSEAVDWLLDSSRQVHSRFHAVSVFQALLEEGVISHVTHEYVFKDRHHLYYRFSHKKLQVAEREFPAHKDFEEVMGYLCNIGPDAVFRMALRTPPNARSQEDVDTIYEELLRIKSLSYISSTVKKEMAAAVVLESCEHKGTVLFNQGDEGDSWYIILKGSVNVVVLGKGIVCQLHTWDDFGRLSLVNNAPRAASIETCEDNCHFLRVSKETFDNILKDVESSSLVLKEHGSDVLVLEEFKDRVPVNEKGQFKEKSYYAVMAGTASKMVDYLLQIPTNKETEKIVRVADDFLVDFLLTYPIFMKPESFCLELFTKYEATDTTPKPSDVSTECRTKKQAVEHRILVKKRVAQVLLQMLRLAKNLLLKEQGCISLILDVMRCILNDNLQDEYEALKKAIASQKREPANDEKIKTHVPTRRTMSFSSRRGGTADLKQPRRSKMTPIEKDDYVTFRVYCADHTYSTVRMRYGDTAQMIVDTAKERLLLGDDCVLCEVKSSGERLVFQGNEISVITRISINSKLFIAPKEHIDSLTPLMEQEGPECGTRLIEVISSREIAYYLTQYEYELFERCNIYEFIYQSFDREKFGQISANLDICLSRFNEVHYWVITEICLATQLSKRVFLLKKFIKIASYCKDYKNLNSAFAIIMALNCAAISRLTQTWEKIPNKYKKLYRELDAILDPSGNHRVYRLVVDITIINYGNKTFVNELVNFEKMRMITISLRLVEYCRSAPFDTPAPSSLKIPSEVPSYVRNLQVIDNGKTLTQLSYRLEPPTNN